MDFTAFMSELASFSVESDVALPQDACSFRLPFGGGWVFVWLYVKEKLSFDELSDGCAQMLVMFLVDVQHWLSPDLFLVFGGYIHLFVSP